MGYKIDGTRIELTRGDSFYCVVSLSRGNEPYTPAEGDRIRFALKRAVLAPLGGDFDDARPLILKTIPNDTLLLHLAPADTKGLSFGSYVYDIELTFASGDVDTFIADAPFELTREVY